MKNHQDLPILLSGFADETSANKRIEEQFAAVVAMGLRRYTLRFADFGEGVKNAIDFSGSENRKLKSLNKDFGLTVATLGSPIGKVKLLDKEDGTDNKYIAFDRYLEEHVSVVCGLAEFLETRLIRGFSFYHPKGEKPSDYIPQVVDQIGQICDRCSQHNLIFGLEVEANLVGQSGELLRTIYDQLRHPALSLIFDAGNLLTQGYSPEETFAEYKKMKPGMGWIHIKDYLPSAVEQKGGYIDEEALIAYRPVDCGSGVYQRVLRDLVEDHANINQRMKDLQLPGLLLDLEPHVRGGGQFGGYSGADGMGIALRSLCKILQEAGLRDDLKNADDLLAS